MRVDCLKRPTRHLPFCYKIAWVGCAAFMMAFLFGGEVFSAEVFSVSMPAWVASLSFSPDGKRLAVGCADSAVRVLESESGKEILALREHKDYVVAVAFGPDGKTLGTGSYDHTVQLWNLARKPARHVLL